MVYVPRKKILVDALAELPAGQREKLMRSERKLVAYLATRDLDEEQTRR